MGIKEFIEENRKQINEYLTRIRPGVDWANQHIGLIIIWVREDLYLYLLARSKGVIV